MAYVCGLSVAGLAWLTPVTCNAALQILAGLGWLTPVTCNAGLQMLAGLAWLTPVSRACRHGRRRRRQRSTADGNESNPAEGELTTDDIAVVLYVVV